MGRVSTCQKNCKTIDLRGAQVNYSINCHQNWSKIKCMVKGILIKRVHGGSKDVINWLSGSNLLSVLWDLVII